MAEIVYSGESFDSVYEAVCHSAVQLVDGCDHASLMLRRSGRVETVAASDDIAQRIDELEKALGEGPASTPSTRTSPTSTSARTSRAADKSPSRQQILAETSVLGMRGFRLARTARRSAP